MRAVDVIRRKRDGHLLSREEIEWFVRANLRGEVSDYQAAALLMAICFRGLDAGETMALTRAFAASGATLDFRDLAEPKADKHSTGGVGDKVTLILAPLVACAGVRLPAIVGRGLGHTGGTIDKLEAIPGFDAFLPLDRFRRIVAGVGCGIIGQTAEICPADRKWYHLRDVTGTVESIPLITASIMSKKFAEGIDALVLDVKFGSGAFMSTLADAEALARSLLSVGERLGLRVRALLTDMNQPLGREVGNANEVREAVDILHGRGDARLTDLCVEMGAHLLDLAGVERDRAAGAARLRGFLNDGRALAKFVEIAEAQGANRHYLEHPEDLAASRETLDVFAPAAGFITAIQTADVGRAAMALGAGRERVEDRIDFGAGLTMHRTVGDAVAAGEPICTLRAATRARLDAAKERLAGAFTIGAARPEPQPTIRKVMNAA